MNGILSGVRVVDLSRFIAGPYCGVLLADMGAEVIKIEKPGTGEVTRELGPWHDGVGLFYPPYNRNKKSVTADMRKPEGIEIAKKLIAQSDVVLENYRAGTMEKMGLGYEDLKRIKPDIIMVSVSGFGQSGPLRDKLAFDGIISAMSGVTRIERDHIERSKGAIHDYMAALHAVYGTMLALYDKLRTGRGQFVDVSMLASSTMIRTSSIADADLNGDEAAMTGDDSAPYGYLRCSDGWLNYHAGPDAIYANLLRVIPDDATLHDPKYKDTAARVEHADELHGAIQRWVGSRTCEEIEAIFDGAGIPSGIVATPGRLLRSPQLNATGALIKQPVHGIEGGASFMGFPFKLSEHREIEYRAAPSVGEHTDEIYEGVLGMTRAEIDALRAKGIV